MYNLSGEKTDLEFGEVLTISNALICAIMYKANRIADLKKEAAENAGLVDESETLFPDAEKEALEEEIENDMDEIEKCLNIIKKIDGCKYEDVKEEAYNIINA